VSFLSEAQRKAYSARAAELLEDNGAVWVQGVWLADVSDRKEVSDLTAERRCSSSQTMGGIRDWLSKMGFGTRNRTAGVCAQGALLLAFAEDQRIPNNVTGSELLRQFESGAKRAAEQMGLLDDDSEFPGTPDLNDNVFGGSDDAVAFLRQMAQATKGVSNGPTGTE
jgi:hypothetical protein